MKHYTIEVTQTVDVVAEDEVEAQDRAARATGMSPGAMDVLDSDPIAPLEGPKAVVEFTPQRWGDDILVEAEPRGPTTWRVPLDDALTDDGTLREDHSHETDQLRDHLRAPPWARRWDGPFSVRITKLIDLPEDKEPDDFHKPA